MKVHNRKQTEPGTSERSMQRSARTWRYRIRLLYRVGQKKSRPAYCCNNFV